MIGIAWTYEDQARYNDYRATVRRVNDACGICDWSHAPPVITVECQRPDPNGLRARFWFAVRWLAGVAREKAGARLDAMRAEQYPGAEEFWGHFDFAAHDCRCEPRP